jgi:uncharacterized protein
LEVKQYNSPKADRVRLVASLPDMGNVGALVAQSLVEHLKARPLAEITSYDRPFVFCKDGLIAEVPSVYKLYYSDTAKLIIMTGDSQPQDSRELYELCNRILDIAAQIGKLERVYTCGGYHREEIPGDPKVYGVTNNPELFEELDRLEIRGIGQEVSSITWFNGVILGVARRRNIDAIGLYGELTRPDIPQPGAAKAVLKSLATLLSLRQIKERRKEEEELI